MLGAFFLMLTVTATFAEGTAQAADHQTNQLEMKARESFAAGRYDEALQTFAKLYAETLHPVYLRNIGRCHQKMREPQKAIDAFTDYLAKSPKTGKEKVSAEERAEIEGYIKEMEALRDEQARAATPVTPVTPLPPGQPVGQNPGTPGATPPSNPPPAMLITTAPPPAPDEGPRPIYKRWWFWTGVGALVVGGVVAAVVLSSGGGGKPTCPAGVTCM